MSEPQPPGSFSPELALVDPDAAELGRHALPAVVLTEDAPRRADMPQGGGQSIAGPRTRRRALVVLACVAGLAVAGVVLGVRLGLGTPGGTSTPSTAAARAAPRTIPDFVWVSATNATRYRVEFVRDGRVVLQKTTAVPRLHVAAATLPPGKYRWHVWALGANGAPVGAALVDAAVDLA